MKRIAAVRRHQPGRDAGARAGRQPARPQPLPHRQRPEPAGLLAFSAVMGFGGAIISLLMSKPMAKWSTGAQVINDSPDATHQWIVDDRQALRRQGRHPDARSGDLRRRAQRLCHRRVQELGAGGGVHRPAAGHEPRRGRGRDRPRDRARGQRRHGDDDADPGRDEHLRRLPVARRSATWSTRSCCATTASGPGIGYYVTTIVLDIVLGVLAAIIVAWFSRQREFRADRGSADLMGNARSR